MAQLRFTLLAEGPTDIAFLPILRWLVCQYAPPHVRVQDAWADLGQLRDPPRELSSRIVGAVDLYPCDVLFVHRDADNQPPDCRYQEIGNAAAKATENGFQLPYICVVPVRTQEAWLLTDAQALRRTAGNPNGRNVVVPPPLSRIESLPDPKNELYRLLRDASGLHGRRLKKFRPEKLARLVPENMRTFEPLRTLLAFQRLERDVQTVIAGWAASRDPA